MTTELSFLEDPQYIRYHIGTPQLPEIWDNYKNVRQTAWNEEEIFGELAVDVFNLDKMPENVRKILFHILGFFAGGDKFVVEVSAEAIIDRITHIEVQMLLRQFMVQEDIHNIVYSRLCETYSKSQGELNNMFSAISQWDSVTAKVKWSKRWLKNAPLAQALLCNIIFEGLFFSSSFCFIFWIDEYFPGLFPGCKLANIWISNDEWNHQSTGTLLYTMTNGLSDDIIYKMIIDAVDVEKKFIKDAFLGMKLPGMNEALMIQYVESVADEILISLGLDRLFGTESPFAWMIKLKINTRAGDFFIGKTAEYNKPDKNPEVDVCVFDEQF